MKIEISMTTDPMFEVNHWWAKKPELVIDILRAHLEVAQAIWPELQGYEVRKIGGKRALTRRETRQDA